MATSDSKTLGGMVLELDFGAGLPRAKRRKIRQACENCKIKKCRCDGSRPVCGPCLSKKATKDTCTWRPFENQSSRSQPSISEQQSSSGEKETESSIPLEISGESSIRSTEHLQRVNGFITKADALARSIHSASPSNYSLGPPTHTRHMSPAASEQSDEKDAMGNYDNEGTRTGLLGTSSSHSFMKSMMDFAEGTRSLQHSGAQEISTKRPHPLSILRKWNSRASVRVADYLLPPRKTADRLLKIHWDKSQIIFPWLDQLEFTRWYESLWTGLEPQIHGNENVLHCILNTIFAISYKLDPSVLAEEQESLASNHFTRAEKLLSINLLDLCHFELIQALLLMGQYLQSTSMPRQCLESISLAIWIAQNLDLHRPEAIASILDPRERELACRVWQGCILFDRVMSMTMGKPLLISQTAARTASLPASMENEYVDGNWTTSPQIDQPIYSEFFTAYCQLHILLGDILQTFYATNSRAQGQVEYSENISFGKQHIDELLAFDDAINSWRNRLPEDLKMNSTKSQTPSLKRQAASLLLRSLHIRMLLFRPFFSYTRAFSVDNEGFSTEHRFAESIRKDGLLACTTSAQLIIETIGSHRDSNLEPHFLPPYWHVIAYTHTAAAVVIAAHLHSIVVQRLTASALSTSLRQAFDILQRYEKDRKSARKCIAALSALCDKIMTFRSRAHSPVGTEDLQTATALNDMVQSLGPTEPFLEADFWNIEDEDMLWLNSAPFDSNNNFWL